jgi:ABC-type glycerol-3-phosphate transport system permease component
VLGVGMALGLARDFRGRRLVYALCFLPFNVWHGTALFGILSLAALRSLVIPFGTWVLWSFFLSFPRDLVDVARLEGAAPVVLLARILLPMAGPALAAVGLFAVAIVFNDFLYSFTLIQSQQQTTLMAGVGLLSTDLGETGPTFAAVLVGVAPIALACAFFADSYAKGLGTGIIE